MISPSQRPLPDNTQHSQQTNIQALGGIRTHNLSRRAAKNLRLRPRGHWDRRFFYITLRNYKTFVSHLFSHKTCKKHYMTHANLYVCSCCCYLMVLLLYRQVSWSQTTCCVQLAARTYVALLSHDLKWLKYGSIPLPKLKIPFKKQASDVALC